MRILFKKCLILIALFTSVAMLTIPAYAVDSESTERGTDTTTEQAEKKTDYHDCRTFLGLPSWDCHINTEPQNEDDLKTNISIIADNILAIIAGIAVYFLIGYVIYGGYLYIFSSGDPAKSTAGKRTLTNAFIGLAIATCARIIISSIGIAIINSNNFDSCTMESGCGVSEAEIITNLINWFIGIAGVVSAAYVVVGGIGYITSSGDPAKLQKSKITIVYALIGLAIVALSLTMSSFAVDAINSANNGEDIRGPIINLLNTVIGLSSIVSVSFAIKGGVGYMTSTGDPAKVKKAKDTILYACIGLVVCAISFAIVNWAIGAIDNTDASQSIIKNNLAFLQKIY